MDLGGPSGDVALRRAHLAARPGSVGGVCRVGFSGLGLLGVVYRTGFSGRGLPGGVLRPGFRDRGSAGGVERSEFKGHGLRVCTGFEGMYGVKGLRHLGY